MRRSIIFASICILLALAGCEGVNPFGETAKTGLSISLDCGTVGTKTPTQDGVGNENLIRTVDYFLFKSGTETYSYMGRVTANATTHYTFYLNAAAYENGEYSVFTIVNYPGDGSDLGISGVSDTRARLEALLLEESTARTFTASPSSGKIVPAAEADLSLVMTGSGTLTVNNAASGSNKGDATISLSRLAAKVSMAFYIKDHVERSSGGVTETWTPLTDGENIRVYLCNGAESIKLGGALPDPLSLFDYEPNTDNTAISGKSGFSKAFSSSAFYTYPESWTRGTAEEPFLKLIVPWKLTRTSAEAGTTESQKEFYYKVMLPTEQFTANYWYHLILDVAQVGGDMEEDAVILTCGYRVANWGTDQTITSTMSPAYFLDVNDSVYDMVFYGDNLDIPYFASGSVTIQDVTIKRTDFLNNIIEDVTNNSYVAKGTGSDYVAIRHPLNTNYEGNAYDVSPYVFTFTLHLDDAGTSDAYDKQIRVTQYPPLYIEQVTSDSFNVNGTNRGTGNNRYRNNYSGYLWVNNVHNTATINGDLNASNKIYLTGDGNNNSPNTTESSPYYYKKYLGTIANPGTILDEGGNTNPRIYEVMSTILDFDMTIGSQTVSVVIGDPRTSSPDNLGFSNSAMDNYYPTAENTQYMISPRFRIASSFGRVPPISYEGAQRRCAAYQENGYPAGRWRLPTAAEIRFLIKLSDDNKIPSLFDPDATNGYWAGGHQACFMEVINGIKVYRFDTISETDGYNISAGANYVRYSKNSTDYKVYTRCVYDTWYWGSEQDPNYSHNWLGFQTATPTH